MACRIRCLRVPQLPRGLPQRGHRSRGYVSSLNRDRHQWQPRNYHRGKERDHHPPRDAVALYQSMKSFLEQPDKRAQMAFNARPFVASRYEQSYVRRCLKEYYKRNTPKMKPYRDLFKRTIDILASGGALLVLSVPLAAITVWLHFANKGAGAFFFRTTWQGWKDFQSSEV